MRKIFSEKNLVVVLFLVTLTIFYFAQEDTKGIESKYLDTSLAAPLILTPEPAPAFSAIPSFTGDDTLVTGIQ